MKYIDKNNHEVKVYAYEVTQHPDIWEKFLDKYQISNGAVPRTFIGKKSFIAYSEEDSILEYSSVFNGYTGYKNQIIHNFLITIALNLHKTLMFQI